MYNLLNGNQNYNDCFEDLKTRILNLTNKAWENRISWKDVENWLDNFVGLTGNTKKIEQLHALFILSQFLYFGSIQIRVLLQALYRDLFLIPLIQELRDKNNGTRDVGEIKKYLQKELELTKFFGIGNPSKSGVHLLYYFRQENDLPSSYFWDITEAIQIKKDSDGKYNNELLNTKILRYVFIDDMCGTGNTAVTYSKNILLEMQNLNRKAIFYYLTLLGTTSGLKKAREESVFKNNCRSVYELDSSYQILSNDPRYLPSCPDLIKKDIILEIVRDYGLKLWPKNPYGYGDGQLVLGMHHNIPNNTIPIIWHHGENNTWATIFKRYAMNKGDEI